MSYSYVDDIEDDDPTEELRVLSGPVLPQDEDDQKAATSPASEATSAANQPFESEQLDAEIREANDRIEELSFELRSRTEMMQSIQVELERLKGFSAFLEKEVEAGKGTIAEVTDELITVRTEQNDAGEQLRRRDRQIELLEGKLAQKDAFIEQFARQADTGDSGDARKSHGPKTNGAPKPAVVSGPAVRPSDSRQTRQKRLRMLVAASDDGRARYPILPGGMSLGTSPENDLRLEDGFVSYRHASITETAAGCVLRDLGSSNGTWINRRRVRWQVLRDGDLIDIGPLRFEFIDRPVDPAVIDPDTEAD